MRGELGLQIAGFGWMQFHFYTSTQVRTTCMKPLTLAGSWIAMYPSNLGEGLGLLTRHARPRYHCNSLIMELGDVFSTR